VTAFISWLVIAQYLTSFYEVSRHYLIIPRLLVVKEVKMLFQGRIVEARNINSGQESIKTFRKNQKNIYKA
jgi:hypothetical protein